MTGTWRPTLRQVFVASLLGLLAGLGGLLWLGFNGSKETILRSSDNYRTLAANFIGSRVTDYLMEAPNAIGHFEDQIRFGAIDITNPDSVRMALLSILLDNENLSEATLTFAHSRGYGPNPQPDTPMIVDRSSVWQIAITRAARRGGFVERFTTSSNGKFFATAQLIMPDSPGHPGPPISVPDPTQHLTFVTTSAFGHAGTLLSTDLHWAQLDGNLPEERRRVEVSVQKTVTDTKGNIQGVLRIGLLAGKVDEAVRQRITSGNRPDEHLIFLCDPQGRLITGFGTHNHVTAEGDDLRVPLTDMPAPVVRALKDPALAKLDEDHLTAASTFRLNGKVYLSSFEYLPGTQDWILGIVVPRNYYLGGIIQTSWQVFWTALVLVSAIFLGGAIILRSVLRAQSQVRLEAVRMNNFDFARSRNRSGLRDVQEVLGSLERAKTAMRAMSKYVPINLVRQLYRDGQEPVPGACPAELSVLFTDIRDFTAIAEQLPPDRLAEVLGRYLQVMATVIQSEQGTIDKYIGDAVMVFWNAPEPVEHHELLACRTALRCGEALQRLYAMPDWGDAPRFETRLGLHRCQASVGHFGSPERLNYTAIGDGINLTSRLEGLNKHYGTSIIASESIYAAAHGHFDFRLLDRVAVKGRMQGITIYELLGAKIDGQSRAREMERYEEAFDHYQRGAFALAIKILESQPQDPPSTVLLARCRDFLEHPPVNWTGVHGFASK